MDLLTATPEKIAKFVSFLVSFAASPQATMEPYAGRDSSGRPALNADLLLFCGLSVGCAVLIVVVGRAIGMDEDSSSSVAVLSRIDEKVLPLIAALGIVLASAVWHGLTLIAGNTLGRLDGIRFSGNVLDSVNAGLAVGALYVPAATLFLVVMRVAVLRTEWSPIFWAVASGAMGIMFLVYFVSAFAAVHRVPPGRYYSVISATVLAIYLIAELIGRL